MDNQQKLFEEWAVKNGYEDLSKHDDVEIGRAHV
jgi:hypothetical protein